MTNESEPFQSGEADQASRQIEDYKHVLAKQLEDHKAQISLSLEKRQFESERVLAIWRAVLDYAQIAIRTVIIANGAGAVTILTFLGNVAKSNSGPVPSPNAHYLGAAAGVFALGVAAGFAATIFAYLSQYQLVRIALLTGQPVVPGIRWERRAGLVSIFLGLVAFLIGVALAVWAYVFS
jgi:ABC-type uncharacterized transport system ATPase subunit